MSHIADVITDVKDVVKPSKRWRNVYFISPPSGDVIRLCEPEFPSRTVLVHAPGKECPAEVTWSSYDIAEQKALDFMDPSSWRMVWMGGPEEPYSSPNIVDLVTWKGAFPED